MEQFSYSVMRLICDDRDRLWNEYGKALRAYSHAVAAVAELPYSHVLWEAVREAQKTVATCRTTIRDHCIEHACNPEWLKDFGNHMKDGVQ